MAKINFGKIIPISTIDWYGRSASTIFFSGCPFRCAYCQNYKLLDCKQLVDIEVIERKILDTKMFISAVVFSGGEPTMQPDGLLQLAEFVKRQGLLVGIQTNGYYPDILKKLVERNLVDKIFLDIKVSPLDTEFYGRVTGRESLGDLVCNRVIQSLNIGAGEIGGRIGGGIGGVDMEIRTTIFRSLNDSLNVAKFLVDNNYFNKCEYVIQQGIPHNTLGIAKKDMLTRKEIMDINDEINDEINKNMGNSLEIKSRIMI